MEELKQLFDHLALQAELESDDMVDMVDMIRRAKQKAKDERLLSSAPLPFMPPMVLVAQQYADRLKWDKRQQETQAATRQTVLGDATYFSSTPLNSLRPSKYS
jgi:hypothetical protein